nr:hypothetical protein RAR13_04470 [Aminobacter aminovorans]
MEAYRPMRATPIAAVLPRIWALTAAIGLHDADEPFGMEPPQMDHCVREAPLELLFGMDNQDITHGAMEPKVLPEPPPGLLDLMAFAAGHGVVHRINIFN